MDNRVSIEDIKFLISRMENPRLTLNEYDEKKGQLLLEGGVTSLIKRINALKVSSFKGILGADISAVKSMKEKVLTELKRVNDAISKNYRSGEKFPDGIALRADWRDYIEELLDVIKSSDEETLLNYLLGELSAADKKSFIVKNDFSPDTLNMLDLLEETTGELTSYATYLDKNSSIINAITPDNMRVSMVAIFKEILKKGETFKSIEEIEAAFIELDNGLTSNSKQFRAAAQSWDSAKRRAGLTINGKVMGGKEITVKFKKEIENSLQYRSVKESMYKRWKRGRDKNKNTTYQHVLEKISSKDVNWERTVIYYDEVSDEVLLVSFNTKRQMEKYINILNQRKIEFSTPVNASEATDQLTKKQSKIKEGSTDRHYRLRMVKVKAIWGGLLAGLAGLAYYCWTISDRGGMSEENKDILKTWNDEHKKQIPITDPKFYDVMICGINVGSYGLTIARNMLNLLTIELQQKFIIITTTLENKINELCDLEGTCECSIDCNDEDAVDAILKDDVELKNSFQLIGDKLRDQMEQAKNWAGYDDEERKEKMKEIGQYLHFGGKDDDGVTYSEGQTELINKDGEVVELGDVFKRICNSKKVDCLRKKVETVVEELLPDMNNPPDGYPKADYDKLKVYNSTRIEQLRSWSERIIIGGIKEREKEENDDKVILQKIKVKELMEGIGQSDTDDVNIFINKIEINKSLQEKGVKLGNLIEEPIDDKEVIISDKDIEKEEVIEFLPSNVWVNQRTKEGFFDGWVCELDDNDNLTGELSEVGKNLIDNKYDIEGRKYFWDFVKENLPKDLEDQKPGYQQELWNSTYEYFTCWQCVESKRESCMK
jgi:hypothetical protein